VDLLIRLPYYFQARFDKQIEFWCTAALSESSDSDQSGNIRFGLNDSIASPILCNDANMLYWRNKSIEKNFQEIKARAPPNQTRMVYLLYKGVFKSIKWQYHVSTPLIISAPGLPLTGQIILMMHRHAKELTHLNVYSTRMVILGRT